MPPPRRLPCLAILALVLAVALTGCMHVDRALHLNEDGSGIYTLTIGFREPTAGDPASVAQNVSAPMDAFGAHVRETGGSYRRFEEQGYAYWAYTRPFASVAEANTQLQEDPRQYDPSGSPVLFRDSVHIAQESRLSSAIFHVTGTISLVDLLDNAQNWRDASESFGITMAGGIIAHRGGARQGNTVTYTIHYDESAAIDVTGRVSGASDVFFVYAPLILVGALAVVAVLLLVLGVRLLRR
jgi:hypothetical protein